MHRREFLSAAPVLAAAPLAAFAAQPADGPQYIEFQQYTLPTGSRQGQVHDFMKNVAIPAYNRMGITPVGVFTVMYGMNNPSLYVLLPHPTLESFATATRRLLADPAAREAGASFLNVPLGEPGYIRMESSIMQAFSGMPRVEAPPQMTAGKPRVFELRIYESHSEPAAKKKIEMFNEGGEIAIFRKTGLTPVFFGETLAGPRMPNLTYMLAFDDMAQRDLAWKAFSGDPDWKQLSADTQYKDTVSAISDVILRPTAYSQI